ncbi:MAG: hypothetical protein EON58_08730 [Alphaproteobacteria bacterium]|nr:MAG: hypothetical protein EON58_08730 [Alphaproteobacteria bacterium]
MKILSFLKQLTLGLGKAALAIIIVFTIFAGYSFVAERSAKSKSTAFCSSIKLGQDPALLLDLAIADGASDVQTRWGEKDGLDTLFVTYVGTPPFSRHMCLIQAKDGRVVSVKQSYLD